VTNVPHDERLGDERLSDERLVTNVLVTKVLAPHTRVNTRTFMQVTIQLNRVTYFDAAQARSVVNPIALCTP
jgi:hypothetical protein